MQQSTLNMLLIPLKALLALTASASAANGLRGTVPPNAGGINPDGALLDSYIQFSKPQVAISDKQSGRDGRTTLTVKFTEDSVSKFTPVVSPQVDGITVDVLNTWDAFKVNQMTFEARGLQVGQQQQQQLQSWPVGATAQHAMALLSTPGRLCCA